MKIWDSVYILLRRLKIDAEFNYSTELQLLTEYHHFLNCPIEFSCLPNIVFTDIAISILPDSFLIYPLFSSVGLFGIKHRESIMYNVYKHRERKGKHKSKRL